MRAWVWAIVWSVLAIASAIAQVPSRVVYTIDHVGANAVTNAATHTLCEGDATCTADTATNQAFVSVETNPIRWWANGDTPSATSGHLANAGATITILGHENVRRFLMIATGGNADVRTSVSRP